MRARVCVKARAPLCVTIGGWASETSAVACGSSTVAAAPHLEEGCDDGQQLLHALLEKEEL